MISDVSDSIRSPSRFGALAVGSLYGWVPALFVLSVHATLAWLARAPGVRTGQDDAIYVLLGRALRGFQYRELFRIDTPIHTMYPPVYPALLAVWSALGGEGFNWLVALNIACSVGALAFTFAAVRRLTGQTVALACLGALAFNPALIDAAGKIASEAPFIFFEAVVMWVLCRNNPNPWLLALAGIAAIAAALTRSVGVTLVLAVGLYWLLQRRFRTVGLFAAAAALTVGLWLASTVVAPEQVPGKSYVADAAVRPQNKTLASALVQRAFGKLPYLKDVYWLLPLPTIEGTVIDNVIGVPFVAIGLLAGGAWLLFSWPAALLYLITYCALLLLWPWVIERFLVPLLPWIVPAVLIGLGRVARLVRPRWELRVVTISAACLLLTGAVSVFAVIAQQHACDPGAPIPSRPCLSADQASFFAATEYIRGHASPNAVVLTGKPATVYFYTNRHVFSLTQALDRPPSEFLDYLRREDVTYVLLPAVMPFSEGVPRAGVRALGPMLEANCRQLALEASFPPSTFLFRVPADAGSASPDAACAAVSTYLQAAKASGENPDR